MGGGRTRTMAVIGCSSIIETVVVVTATESAAGTIITT
jgi:hypothetical protein